MSTNTKSHSSHLTGELVVRDSLPLLGNRVVHRVLLGGIVHVGHREGEVRVRQSPDVRAEYKSNEDVSEVSALAVVCRTESRTYVSYGLQIRLRMASALWYSVMASAVLLLNLLRSPSRM